MLEQTDRTHPSASARPARQEHIRVALGAACGRICPVWDIKSFIAANSLQGFEGVPFGEAVEAARAYFHADALMPLSFYREQFRAGRIALDDVRVATRDHRAAGVREEDLFAASAEAPARGEVLTLAEHVDRARGTHYSRSSSAS